MIAFRPGDPNAVSPKTSADKKAAFSTEYVCSDDSTRGEGVLGGGAGERGGGGGGRGGKVDSPKFVANEFPGVQPLVEFFDDSATGNANVSASNSPSLKKKSIASLSPILSVERIEKTSCLRGKDEQSQTDGLPGKGFKMRPRISIRGFDRQ